MRFHRTSLKRIEVPQLATHLEDVEWCEETTEILTGSIHLDTVWIKSTFRAWLLELGA